PPPPLRSPSMTCARASTAGWWSSRYSSSSRTAVGVGGGRAGAEPRRASGQGVLPRRFRPKAQPQAAFPLQEHVEEPLFVGAVRDAPRGEACQQVDLLGTQPGVERPIAGEVADAVDRLLHCRLKLRVPGANRHEVGPEDLNASSSADAEPRVLEDRMRSPEDRRGGLGAASACLPQ